MSRWQIAINSLAYYWRSNTVVALGVAIATAVLTGALIVALVVLCILALINILETTARRKIRQ